MDEFAHESEEVNKLLNELFILFENALDYKPVGDMQSNKFQNKGKISKTVNKLDLCRVCGVYSGSHNYFGGQCCLSCRAFFRRNVLSKLYGSFRCCKGDGKCIINSKTRKNCQYCRFQGCLKANMKINWVHLEGEPRNRKLSKYQKLRDQMEEEKVVVIYQDPVMTLTCEEILLIDRIKSKLGNYQGLKSLSLLENDDGSRTAFMEYLLNPRPRKDIDYDSYFNQFFDIGFENYFKSYFANDTLELSPHDQEILYLNNFRSNKEYKRSLLLVDISICRIIETLVQNVVDLNSIEFPTQKSLNFFPNKHFQSELDWSRYYENSVKMNNWTKDGTSSKDETMSLLMNSIMFFNTDFIDGLRDRSTADHLKLKYSLLLFRYLKQKNPSKANQIFTDGLMNLHLSKENSEITRRMIWIDQHD